MKWTIKNYHYEERRDKDGNKKRVRVNTHRASTNFNFSDWKDMSDKIDILFFLEKLYAVRVHCTKNFRYSPKAKKMF